MNEYERGVYLKSARASLRISASTKDDLDRLPAKLIPEEAQALLDHIDAQAMEIARLRDDAAARDFGPDDLTLIQRSALVELAKSLDGKQVYHKTGVVLRQLHSLLSVGLVTYRRIPDRGDDDWCHEYTLTEAGVQLAQRLLKVHDHTVIDNLPLTAADQTVLAAWDVQTTVDDDGLSPLSSNTARQYDDDPANQGHA